MMFSAWSLDSAQEVTEEKIEELKAGYKQLWDFDANDMSDIQRHIQSNAKDGIPIEHNPSY